MTLTRGVEGRLATNNGNYSTNNDGSTKKSGLNKNLKRYCKIPVIILTLKFSAQNL